MEDEGTTDSITPPLTRRLGARMVIGGAASVLVHAAMASLFWFGPEVKPVPVHFEWQGSSELVGLGQGSETPDPAPDPVEEVVEAAPDPKPEVAPEPVAPPEPNRNVAVALPPKKLPPPPEEPEDQAEKDGKEEAPDDGEEEGEEARQELEEKEGEEAGLRAPFNEELPFEVRPQRGIKSFAPGNALMSVAVNAKGLRRSQHRENFARMIRAIPDYHRVTGLSGVEPIDAYDKVLITSANFSVLTETMLLASTESSDDSIKGHLDKVVGEPLVWESVDGVALATPQQVWWARRGDPRVFMLPAPGIVAFAKPGLSSYLASRARSVKRRKGHFFPEFSDSIGPAKADLPVVFMMEMSGLHIRIGGDFTHLPMPQAIKATIRDDLRPLVQLRLTFGDKDKASGFMQHWPGVRKKLLDMFVLRVLGYRDLLKRIDFARAGEREVYLEVRAEPGEIARLSKFLSRLVENNFRHFLPQPGDWPEADAGEGDTDDVDLDGEALADGDPDAARPPMEGAGKAGPDAAADLPSSSDGSRSKAPKLKLWRTR